MPHVSLANVFLLFLAWVAVPGVVIGVVVLFYLKLSRIERTLGEIRDLLARG